MPRSTHLTALAFISASVFLLSTAYAANSYSVGQRLNAEQTKDLGSLQSVEVNGRKYQVLQMSQSAAGLPFTMLLDANGMVGKTYHELQIVEQPTAQVRQQLTSVLSQAQEVKYYDQAHITLLRFATLEQAVKALAQIHSAMPDAEIGIPITFSRPSLR